jgi:hypothetical protein
LKIKIKELKRKLKSFGFVNIVWNDNVIISNDLFGLHELKIFDNG